MPSRTRKKKVVDPDEKYVQEELLKEEVAEASEMIQEDLLEKPKRAPRATKPSPKKVLNETGKAIADASAAVLTKASEGKDGKGLLFAEAQSITTPLVRIAGRRVPNWLKQFMPKTKLKPEDAADIEEIAVTLGKYALRVLMLTVGEWIEKQEERRAKKPVQENVPQHPRPQPMVVPSILVPVESEKQAAPTTVSTNSHHPLFSHLPPDFGVSEVS